MKRKSKIAATVFGFCLLAMNAQAADVLYDGNFCQPVIADLNRVEHGPQYGIHNISSVTTNVQCPFNPPFLGTVSHVGVVVYDRHPSINVTCTVRGIDFAGTVLWSQTRASTGSGAAWQYLSFSPSASTHTMTMRCTIPPVYFGNYSHLTTYRATTSP